MEAGQGNEIHMHENRRHFEQIYVWFRWSGRESETKTTPFV
jgi:hypothetical protein